MGGSHPFLPHAVERTGMHLSPAAVNRLTGVSTRMKKPTCVLIWVMRGTVKGGWRGDKVMRND